MWEWNKLDLKLRNAKSFKRCRNTLLKLGRPTPDLIYGIHNPLGLKLLTRLSSAWVTLTKIDLNIILKTALTHFVHVLLKSSQLSISSCTVIIIQYSVFLSFSNDLVIISPQFALHPEDVFVKTLLYGNPIFDENGNQEMLETSIKYILDSKRFSGGL